MTMVVGAIVGMMLTIYDPRYGTPWFIALVVLWLMGVVV